MTCDYHINVFYTQDDGGSIADIPDLDACSAFGTKVCLVDRSCTEGAAAPGSEGAASAAYRVCMCASRNDASGDNHRIFQPDGTTVAVRNGMTGRVVATRRRSLTVELDTAHRAPGGPVPITLPATYVGEHVDYGYARTVDTPKAQPSNTASSHHRRTPPPNAPTSPCPAAA